MADLSRPTWRGRTNVDALTIQAIEQAERDMGFTLVITQGSYNTSVSASAGTHARGGVVDFSTRGLTNARKGKAIRRLRSVGFAAWVRYPWQGGWPEHIHAVLIGHPRLSAAAVRQVRAYRNGRDGLAANRSDYHWRPSPIPTYRWRNPVRIDGVDISHHQGNVPAWKMRRARKRGGVKWLYAKATEGDSWTDDRYDHNRRMAAKAGLPFGAYHFARPSRGDAAAEARHFLRVAKPRPGDLLPMLDLEDRGGLSRAQLTTWTRTFVQVVRNHLDGVKPLLYTPFHLDQTLGLVLWVARYSNNNRHPNVPSPWPGFDIWQFSNGVYGRPNRVAGLGRVDLNTMRPGLSVADITIPQEEDMPYLDWPERHRKALVADIVDEMFARRTDPEGDGEKVRQFDLNADLTPNVHGGKPPDTVRNFMRHHDAADEEDSSGES